MSFQMAAIKDCLKTILVKIEEQSLVIDEIKEKVNKIEGYQRMAHARLVKEEKKEEK